LAGDFEWNPIIVRNDGRTAQTIPARSNATTGMAAPRETV
jgi:hypothetical protein